MKKITTDVDIDLADRDKVLENLTHHAARIDRKDGYEKHNTGVYFQDIPYDPFDNIATIDYKIAEDLGYFKIDFLNNSVYKDIEDEEHLNKLLAKEPTWELLQHQEFIENLFHIGNYSKLVKQMKPTSVKHLAMLLAIIRPAKKHLQGKSWDEIKKEIWNKPTDGSYHFKKSHAHGYALVILVQMNLLVEQNIKQNNL